MAATRTLIGKYWPATAVAEGDRELALRAAEIWQGLSIPSTSLTDVVVLTESPDEQRHVRVCSRDGLTGLPTIRELDPDTGKPIDSPSNGAL